MKPRPRSKSVVEVVQRQVREKRRERRALRHALLARALQELLHHREHLAVADPPRDLRQHPVVPDAVEVAREINVDDAVLAAAQSRSHLLDRLVRRTSRARPEGAVREVGFEDRFQNQPEGALDHAVSDRGDRDHADLAALLRNLSSSIRPGAVRAGAQVRGEFREELAAAALPRSARTSRRRIQGRRCCASPPDTPLRACRASRRGHAIPRSDAQGRISPDGLSSREALAD